MAQTWDNNDSARVMTRKYNDGVMELNRLADMVVAVNESYIVSVPSEFAVENDTAENDTEGADGAR